MWFQNKWGKTMTDQNAEISMGLAALNLTPEENEKFNKVQGLTMLSGEHFLLRRWPVECHRTRTSGLCCVLRALVYSKGGPRSAWGC